MLRAASKEEDGAVQMLTSSCPPRYAPITEFMLLLLQLHYAYRLLLTYLDRWKALTTARVDGPSACHAVDAHTAFPPSQPTHHQDPPTPTPPARLLRSSQPPMNPAKAARYTIANEFSRRRTQLARTSTLHTRHREQRARLRRIVFEDTSLASPSRFQSARRRAVPIRARKLVKPDKYATELERPRDMDHRNQDQSISVHQRRRSNMWKLGLGAGSDRQQSSIFAALHQDTHPASPKTRIAEMPPHEEFDDWGSDEFPDQPTGAREWISANGHSQEPDTTPEIHINMPWAGKGLGQKHRTDSHSGGSIVNFFTETHPAAPPMDSISPSSDSTLYEVATANLYGQAEGDRPWDDAMNDSPSGKQTTLSRAIQFEKDQIQTPTPIRRRCVQREQSMSPTSPGGTARTPSVPLRVRDRTHDGLLQLKANVAHHSTSPTDTMKTHRRKISLNLPVNTCVIKTDDGLQHSNPGSWAVSPQSTVKQGSVTNSTTALSAEERELEYKHRYTFIGIGSLDDFLEILEITPARTTSRDAAAKAFVHLAANEQRLARQHSTKLQGWELVPRITPDVPTGDYVAQHQVKLGSITLRQFLDLIPFGDSTEIPAMCVVEAFLAACHLDGRVMGDKARLFRRWMLDQACEEAR